MIYTHRQELEDALRLFQEIYLTHLDNQDIKDMASDIIAYYQEELQREDRLDDYERKYLTGSKADPVVAVQYP